MQVAERTLKLPRPAPSQTRMDWVDNLRTLMILLVVNIHACVTYSFVGSWYFNAPPEPSVPMKIPFFLWEAHLQSFFMGLLFFVGGYYADRSLTRRGATSFLAERTRRLGLPALVYMLVIDPFIVLVLHPGYAREAEPLRAYVHYLSSGKFLGSSGPMWFAVALLIFSGLFAPIAKLIPARVTAAFRLSPGTVAGIAIATGVVSFLIRTVQPIGASVLNMQFCFFAQYVVAFGLGVYVSRRDALAAIAESPLAKRAGWFALVLGPIALIGIVVASLPIPDHGQPAFTGGWNVLAFAMAVWEQLVGFGLGLGAMALCVTLLNRRGRVSAWLADRSFAVYMLHPPILVALTLAAQPYRTNPFVMAPVMTVLALTASFAIADLARRAPGLRTLL